MSTYKLDCPKKLYRQVAKGYINSAKSDTIHQIDFQKSFFLQLDERTSHQAIVEKTQKLLKKYFDGLKIDTGLLLDIYNSQYKTSISKNQDIHAQHHFSRIGMDITIRCIQSNNITPLSQALTQTQLATIQKKTIGAVKIGKQYFLPQLKKQCIVFKKKKKDQSFYTYTQLPDVTFSTNQKGQYTFWEKTDKGLVRLTPGQAIYDFFYNSIEKKVKKQNQQIKKKYFKDKNCILSCKNKKTTNQVLLESILNRNYLKIQKGESDHEDDKQDTKQILASLDRLKDQKNKMQLQQAQQENQNNTFKLIQDIPLNKFSHINIQKKVKVNEKIAKNKSQKSMQKIIQQNTIENSVLKTTLSEKRQQKTMQSIIQQKASPFKKKTMQNIQIQQKVNPFKKKTMQNIQIQQNSQNLQLQKLKNDNTVMFEADQAQITGHDIYLFFKNQSKKLAPYQRDSNKKRIRINFEQNPYFRQIDNGKKFYQLSNFTTKDGKPITYVQLYGYIHGSWPRTSFRQQQQMKERHKQQQANRKQKLRQSMQPIVMEEQNVENWLLQNQSQRQNIQAFDKQFPKQKILTRVKPSQNFPIGFSPNSAIAYARNMNSQSDVVLSQSKIDQIKQQTCNNQKSIQFLQKQQKRIQKYVAQTKFVQKNRQVFIYNYNKIKGTLDKSHLVFQYEENSEINMIKIVASMGIDIYAPNYICAQLLYVGKKHLAIVAASQILNKYNKFIHGVKDQYSDRNSSMRAKFGAHANNSAIFRLVLAIGQQFVSQTQGYQFILYNIQAKMQDVTIIQIQKFCYLNDVFIMARVIQFMLVYTRLLTPAMFWQYLINMVFFVNSYKSNNMKTKIVQADYIMSQVQMYKKYLQTIVKRLGQVVLFDQKIYVLTANTDYSSIQMVQKNVDLNKQGIIGAYPKQFKVVNGKLVQNDTLQTQFKNYGYKQTFWNTFVCYNSYFIVPRNKQTNKAHNNLMSKLLYDPKQIDKQQKSYMQHGIQAAQFIANGVLSGAKQVWGLPFRFAWFMAKVGFCKLLGIPMSVAV